MRNIFRSPWLYVGLYLLIDLATTLFNPVWNKVNYWLLQPIPDNVLDEDPLWLGAYTLFFTLLLPAVLIYFASKWILERSR